MTRRRIQEGLLIVGIALVISAVGQGFFDDAFSETTSIVFTLIGSLCLAAAIVVASVEHDRSDRSRRGHSGARSHRKQR